jgi:hypothetical protein
MTGGDQGEFGAFEGTHAAPNSPAAAPDPERAAKVGATAATVEAAIGDLVAGIGQAEEFDQPSLMLDEMDEQFALFNGPVRHVAETIDGSRRARGRPKGSQNKNAFRDVLMRMGFRHPGLNLAALANADPHALAVELSGMPMELDGKSGQPLLQAYLALGLLKRDQVIGLIGKAHELIRSANAELMPYFESKRPTEIDITETVKGVMIIGEMKTDRGADGDILDLTSVPAPD